MSRVAEELKIKLEKATTMYDTLLASSKEREGALDRELTELKESEKNMRVRYAKQLQEAESKSVAKPSMISSFANSNAFTVKRAQSSMESLGASTLPSGMKSSASFERMQSIMKQNESEVVSLKDQISRLEQSKANLEDQLVKLTSSNDH